MRRHGKSAGRSRWLQGVGCSAVLWAGLACSQAPPPEVPGPEDPGTPATGDAAEARPAAPEEPLPEPPPEPGAGDGEAGGGDESSSDGDPADGDDDEIRIERGASVERDDSVILIERGGRSRPPSLYEAARKAREERDRSGPSRVTINDENLHEFQGKGLTFAEPATEEDGQETGGGEGAGDGEPQGAGTAGEPGESSGGMEAETGETEPAGGEEYWRSRLLDLRLRLREAVDELDELKERAGSLRRSFYAQDDPYVRDGRIKPAWDRVLDRIGETRRRIGTLRQELQQALQEGRRAGALPGWLREGIELEPAPEELPEESDGEPGRHRPEDPRVVEEEREPPG